MLARCPTVVQHRPCKCSGCAAYVVASSGDVVPQTRWVATFGTRAPASPIPLCCQPRRRGNQIFQGGPHREACILQDILCSDDGQQSLEDAPQKRTSISSC